MLNALRKRIANQDEGFTLIELMVVVLIIGILMAIAIPTFLGAKSKANDRAAQSDITNALTAQKTYYTDNQVYATTVAAISAVEPGLQWTPKAPTLAGQVYSAAFNRNGAATEDNVIISSYSTSNHCFYESDEQIAGKVAAPGTYFEETNGACAATPPAPPAAAPTVPTASSKIGSWALAW